MSIENDDRAAWAGEAIDVFARITGIEDEHDGMKLGDLLCDLMHWADARGIDFDERLVVGLGHYEAELGFEEDES